MRFIFALVLMGCTTSSTENTTPADDDGDGVTALTDCDDNDDAIHPDAEEIWYDGVDQNCDGLSDYDQDMDGVDSADHDGTDCDDTKGNIFPGAEEEWYDGIDQNCDDASDYDQDGDGHDAYDHGGSDCDDEDSTAYVGATETWYDGVDQDCDRWSDYDQDQDGEDSADHGGNDCDDLDPSFVTISVILPTTPNDGALDVFYDTSIRATLTVADPLAFIQLTDTAGIVPGTTGTDANDVWFEPTNSLASGTDYEWTITHACGDATQTFTTSEVGPPTTPTDLIDKTYLIDGSSGTWVQPLGIGPLLQQQGSDMFLKVVDANATELTLRGATGDVLSATPAQEMCATTGDVEGVNFAANPWFDAEIDDAQLYAPIDDLIISGAFSPDGTYIQGIRVEGTMDTRPLVPLLDPLGDDDLVCDLVATFGVSCIVCPDGSGDYCLDVLIEDMVADESTVNIVERTEADILADTACTDVLTFESWVCASTGAGLAGFPAWIVGLSLMRRRRNDGT
jgi:hypothetical protein